MVKYSEGRRGSNPSPETVGAVPGSFVGIHFGYLDGLVDASCPGGQTNRIWLAMHTTRVFERRSTRPVHGTIFRHLLTRHCSPTLLFLSPWETRSARQDDRAILIPRDREIRACRWDGCYPGNFQLSWSKGMGDFLPVSRAISCRKMPPILGQLCETRGLVCFDERRFRLYIRGRASFCAIKFLAVSCCMKESFKRVRHFRLDGRCVVYRCQLRKQQFLALRRSALRVVVERVIS